MSAHTPGPWKFSEWEQWGDTRFYISQDDGAPYTPNYSDVAHFAAETCSGEWLNIQKANARLIAAAPDLLEALIAVRDRKHTPDLWEMVNAAIAKATGAQQ